MRERVLLRKLFSPISSAPAIDPKKSTEAILRYATTASKWTYQLHEGQHHAEESPVTVDIKATAEARLLENLDDKI